MIVKLIFLNPFFRKFQFCFFQRLNMQAGKYFQLTFKFFLLSKKNFIIIKKFMRKCKLKINYRSGDLNNFLLL